jgi:hypothetical protein
MDDANGKRFGIESESRSELFVKRLWLSGNDRLT